MVRLCPILLLSLLSILYAVEPSAPLRIGVMANRGELAAKTMWTEFAVWIGIQCGRTAELSPLAIQCR